MRLITSETKWLNPGQILYAWTTDPMTYPIERVILSEIRDEEGNIKYLITTCGKVYHFDFQNRIWVSTEYSLKELIDLSFDVASPFPKKLMNFISEYFKRAMLYYKYPEKYQDEKRENW